jgi:predicted secreted protein
MKNSLYMIVILAVMVNLAFIETSVGQEQTTDTIQAALGEEFVIIFDAKAATGYEWQLASPIDNKLVKFVSSGDKLVWTFKALQTGKTQISFKYVRQRKKNALAEKKAVYIVNIRDSVKTPEIPKITETLIPYSAAYNSPNTGADAVEVDEDAE